MIETPAFFSRIRVVLCQTSHPGNIGATARAMGTMGLTRLWLVAPEKFPHPQATAMASNAWAILHQAEVVKTVGQALQDVSLAIGFSARQREIAMPQQWVAAAMTSAIAHADQAEVALVFGNETYGLSNQELALCQMTAIIPSLGESSALNVAAAVQVASYELCKQSLLTIPVGGKKRRGEIAATFAEREGILGDFAWLLKSSKLKQPERAMLRLRRIFAKASLEKDEVNLLRGLLKKKKSPFTE